MSVAVGATTLGCAVGPDAVRKDRPRRAVETHQGPGYLGDRAAAVAVVMERLAPETIDCASRGRRGIRCHLERDTGTWHPHWTYVDVHISRDGRRLTAAGPGVARFAARYARGG